MRAVIYCRISRDRTGEQAGVDRQREDCVALCEAAGFEVLEILSDNDLSAFSGKPRPGYRRLIEVVARGPVDVLVAWHPDRFTRHPRELEDFIDLVEASNAKVRTVMAGEYDLPRHPVG